jgi:hypothetical protein
MAALPFQLPEVEDNATGWGPQGEPSVFAGIPYQPFSKSDKLGKVAAEFTGATNFRRGKQLLKLNVYCRDLLSNRPLRQCVWWGRCFLLPS